MPFSTLDLSDALHRTSYQRGPTDGKKEEKTKEEGKKRRGKEKKERRKQKIEEENGYRRENQKNKFGPAAHFQKIPSACMLSDKHF